MHTHTYKTKHTGANAKTIKSIGNFAGKSKCEQKFKFSPAHVTLRESRTLLLHTTTRSMALGVRFWVLSGSSTFELWPKQKHKQQTKASMTVYNRSPISADSGGNFFPSDFFKKSWIILKKGRPKKSGIPLKSVRLGSLIWYGQNLNPWPITLAKILTSKQMRW